MPGYNEPASVRARAEDASQGRTLPIHQRRGNEIYTPRRKDDKPRDSRSERPHRWEGLPAYPGLLSDACGGLCLVSV